MNELSEAWQTSIHRGLGVFSPNDLDDGEVEPLVISEEVRYIPPDCDPGPHQLWSQVELSQLRISLVLVVPGLFHIQIPSLSKLFVS